MKFNAMFKECMTPHGILHYFTGIAFGFLILYFVPILGRNLLTLGIVILVTAFVTEFFVNPKR